MEDCGRRPYPPYLISSLPVSVAPQQAGHAFDLQQVAPKPWRFNKNRRDLSNFLTSGMPSIAPHLSFI
jgi:hypothetical protein